MTGPEICDTCHLVRPCDCGLGPTRDLLVPGRRFVFGVAVDEATDDATAWVSRCRSVPTAAEVARSVASAAFGEPVTLPPLPLGSSSTMRQVSDDVEYLTSSWPALVEMSTPGARVRLIWRRSRPTAEAAEQAAVLARQERDDARLPGAVPGSGPRPAPLSVSLLDLLATVVDVCADVAEQVTQAAGVERRDPPTSCWVDVRPYLLTARHWLPMAVEAEPSLERAVALRLRALADQVAATLGELHDGQVLEALCPWCGGRTPASPVGGENTLVVYARLTRREQASGDVAPGSGEGPLIVCRGMGCAPSESDVGTWVGEHPAWPLREWDWLAKQLTPCTLHRSR